VWTAANVTTAVIVPGPQTQQAPSEEPSGPRACANSHYASVR
jgi:hypothetical protein